VRIMIIIRISPPALHLLILIIQSREKERERESVSEIEKDRERKKKWTTVCVGGGRGVRDIERVRNRVCVRNRK
jgi:hypothetical protein